MILHLHREIDRLKQRFLGLSAEVEEAVRKSVQALLDKNTDLAQEVLDEDERIDASEVEIEEECLKILALYQPVAVDLRYIVAILKINSDVERIGDLAVNIAEEAIALSRLPRVVPPFDVAGMAAKVQSMMHRSLDSLVELDAQLAVDVCADDDEVDHIHRAMYRRVEDAIRNDPDHLEAFIHLLGVSRSLERIADHATNIAEDVVYMARGDIPRHRMDEFGTAEG